MLRFSLIYMYFDSSMKFDIWSKAKSYHLKMEPFCVCVCDLNWYDIFQNIKVKDDLIII